jgi:hypothetical protein
VIISSESINKVYTNPSPFQLLRFNAHVIFTIVVVDFYKMETIRYNVACQPSSYWQWKKEITPFVPFLIVTSE